MLCGVIPRESYERIACFLNKEERLNYLEEEYTDNAVIDAWWNGNDQIGVQKFISVVEITEPRFLNQPDLVSRIEHSSELKKLSAYANEVRVLVGQGGASLPCYQHDPQKDIDNVPATWFQSAEQVLFNHKGILNANTVKLLAADAWRQNLIEER